MFLIENSDGILSSCGGAETSFGMAILRELRDRLSGWIIDIVVIQLADFWPLSRTRAWLRGVRADLLKNRTDALPRPLCRLPGPSFQLIDFLDKSAPNIRLESLTPKRTQNLYDYLDVIQAKMDASFLHGFHFFLFGLWIVLRRLYHWFT